ncbi:unnamed protein product [Dracunculus medinensis]|uniref:Uncharacterized protein n=1 Tax=Dracunculus medinensis TaxID=318479 RepID=A0A0N4URC4_DRAME|nr:unnamed protein product [Dracunculus medinensis]
MLTCPTSWIPGLIRFASEAERRIFDDMWAIEKAQLLCDVKCLTRRDVHDTSWEPGNSLLTCYKQLFLIQSS